MDFGNFQYAVGGKSLGIWEWGREDYWKSGIIISPGAMHPAERSLL